MKLVIFDLDQTLVDFIKVHDDAVNKLFKKHFGVSVWLTDIDFAGRSLSDSFIEIARTKNLGEDEVKRNTKKLLKDYEHLFGESIPPDAEKLVLPGARELLDALSKTDNFLALYTGNPPGAIDSILRSSKLSGYFKLTFSGTEVKSRADMVAMAAEKAEEMTGNKFGGRQIVIFGDSVRDIQAGRVFNAVTIAVATGFHTREELLKERPDYLIDNLEDCKKILRIIGE